MSFLRSVLYVTDSVLISTHFKCVICFFLFDYVMPLTIVYDDSVFVLKYIKYLDKMAAYLEKLDDALRTPGRVDEIATLIEQKTKVQRKYIGLGAVCIAMGLILTTLAPLVVNIIAFAYPAFKSIKACSERRSISGDKTFNICTSCTPR